MTDYPMRIRGCGQNTTSLSNSNWKTAFRAWKPGNGRAGWCTAVNPARQGSSVYIKCQDIPMPAPAIPNPR